MQCCTPFAHEQGNVPSPTLSEGEIRVARLLESAVRIRLSKTDARRSVCRRVAAQVCNGLDQQRGWDKCEDWLPDKVAVGLLGQVPRGNVELIGEGGDRRATIGEAGEGNLAGVQANYGILHLEPLAKNVDE